jgi:hypothetical protein
MYFQMEKDGTSHGSLFSLISTGGAKLPRNNAKELDKRRNKRKLSDCGLRIGEGKGLEKGIGRRIAPR